MNRVLALVVGCAIVWSFWLGVQPFKVWVPFGIITIILLAENYCVNVKSRTIQGIEETNPVWVRIERNIPFKYAAPLVLVVVTAFLVCLASVTKLGSGLTTIPLVWAPTFTTALICSTNGAYVLWSR